MPKSPLHEARNADGFLIGGGEMGAQIRSFDWTGTPIGSFDSWSPALRSTVRLMLANRFPLLLWWGPQYISIYNDAYVPILGAKHPNALGQPVSECWSEIWHLLQPLIDQPFHGGPATWIEDLMLEVNRHGFIEEGHWTVAYSPVPDDTVEGGIGGVLATVHEITEKVLGERRVQVLRDIGARSAEPKTAEEACSMAADILAQHPKDIPFALLYLIESDEQHARQAGAVGMPYDSASIPLFVDFTSEASSNRPWPLAEALCTETLQIVQNLSNRLGDNVPHGPWSDPPRQAVMVPIRSHVAHRSAGVLVAGVSSRLKLDEPYLSFYELLSSQIATTIANARAYEEERKRAEALAELDRAKTVFFGNVSHEFRTPLTLMIGPVEDLLDRSYTELSPATKGQLEIVHRNALRLLKLVNTMLDFSRIEAGRMRANYEETDLAAYTAELASNFRSACDRAGLSLAIHCPPAPVGHDSAYIDRDMWEKIVLNLLSNAFKYTLEGGITVSLVSVDDQVELTVRDTGVGIPPEELPRLFERFHRVKGSVGRTHEGTGIGLALVRELATLHGGTVGVESTLGRGSTFTVSIPLGKTHLDSTHIHQTGDVASTRTGAGVYVEEAMRWLPAAAAGGKDDDGLKALRASAWGTTSDMCSVGDHKRPRIIWADDNADMRDYVTRLLSERFEVVTAADGQAALDHARAMQQEGRPPDLVLSDVMMPRLDGFALLRKLRDDPALGSIPILLLSARAGEEARIEGVEAGADDYLIKPFSARELVARVESQVKMAALRREADRALRESERRFRDTANAAPAMLWVTEADGACSFLSRGWYEFTGQTGEEGRGFGWLDPVHPEDRPESSRVFLDANRQHEPFILYYRLRRADGEYRWCVDAGRPRFDETGNFQGYVGSVIDITERKVAEDALHEREAWLDGQCAALEAALNGAPLATSLGALVRTATGRLGQGVRAAFYLADDDGTSLHHVVGMPVGYAQAVEGFIIGPESPACGLAVHTGQPILTTDVMHDARWKPWLWLTEKFEFRGCWSFPICTTAGNYVGSFAVYWPQPRAATPHDLEFAALVTQTAAIIIARHIDAAVRRRANEELRESEARFRAFISATSDVVYRMSPDWAEMRCLQGRDFIKDMLEPSRTWFDAYIPPYDQPRVMDAIERAIQSKSIVELEHRVIRVDGSLGWAHSRAIPILDECGEIVEWFGAASDVTQRKQAEEALRVSEWRLRQSAEQLEQRVMARTGELLESQARLRALTSELNLAEQRERKRLATELHDHLQQLLVLGKIELGRSKRLASGVPGCDAALKRVDDVLAEALTYSRTLVADLSPPVLHDHGLVASLRWLREYMKKHHLTVTVIVPEGQEPTILDDERVLLFQSVRELLINSAKHAGTGQATLTVERREDNLCVTVSDTGKGFDLVAAAGIPSSGIPYKYGLYSIQERMRALGGSFTIDSAPGQGTTASLVVPLITSAEGRRHNPELSESECARAPLPVDDFGGHT